ncbi:hypothetical protein HII12_004414 [Brettanomyces bruxellensis]|uniref:PA14 domain-containing protein n=1 Tax=Dekkera bruxellensis TaxID=5007 RepID=A0A8H6ERD3_DEKBR|nr:hypothetical protein HII12_004414 [Brettanomyces bruxellensis]
MLSFKRQCIIGLILLQTYLGTALAATATTGGIGCNYGAQVGSVSGFRATYYSYPDGDTAAGDTSDGSVSTIFFESSYSEFGLIGSITTDVEPTVSYNYAKTSDVVSIGTFSINAGHFVLELDGYFYAKTSGVYTLELVNVDDFAAVWFGQGLDCCDSTYSSDEGNDVPDFATGRSFSEDENGASSYSVYLSAGSYYPIKIRYVNAHTRGLLNFIVVDPSGNSITEFDDYVYQFVNIDGACTTVTVTLPPNTITTTMNIDSPTTTTVGTTYTSGDSTITTTVVLVEEPPLSTTTTHTDVDAITTTTVATTYTSGESTITTTVVLVEEPPLSTTTTTEDIDVATTTTVATTYTIAGKAFVRRFVLVGMPYLYKTATATEDIDAATTTTVATTYTSGGSTITSTVVLVGEPPLSGTTTTSHINATTTALTTTYTSGDSNITSTIVVDTDSLLSTVSGTSTTTSYLSDNSAITSEVESTGDSSLLSITIATDINSVTTVTAATTYASGDNTITSSVAIVKEPYPITITTTADINTPTTATVTCTYTSSGRTIFGRVVLIEEPSLPIVTTTTDVDFVTTTTIETTYTSEGKVTTGEVILVEKPELSIVTVTTDISCKSTTTKISTFTSNKEVLTSSVIFVEEPFSSDTNKETISTGYAKSETFGFYTNSSSSTVEESSGDTAGWASTLITTDVKCSSTATTLSVTTISGGATNGAMTELPDIVSTSPITNIAVSVTESGYTSTEEAGTSSKPQYQSNVIVSTAEKGKGTSTPTSTFESKYTSIYIPSESKSSSSEYAIASSVAIYEGAGTRANYAITLVISALIGLIV